MTTTIKDIEDRLKVEYAEDQDGSGFKVFGIEYALGDVSFLLSEHKRLSEEVERLGVAYTNIGNSVLVMPEDFKDEGDRVYLNSTNDAEVFRRLGAKYWDWKMEQMAIRMWLVGWLIYRSVWFLRMAGKLAPDGFYRVQIEKCLKGMWDNGINARAISGAGWSK